MGKHHLACHASRRPPRWLPTANVEQGCLALLTHSARAAASHPGELMGVISANDRTGGSGRALSAPRGPGPGRGKGLAGGSRGLRWGGREEEGIGPGAVSKASSATWCQK